MTYKESYLMCDSIEQIKEFAIHDICVAKLSLKIKKIRKSAEEAIIEKFLDHIADFSKKEEQK